MGTCHSKGSRTYVTKGRGEAANALIDGEPQHIQHYASINQRYGGYRYETYVYNVVDEGNGIIDLKRDYGEINSEDSGNRFVSFEHNIKNGFVVDVDGKTRNINIDLSKVNQVKNAPNLMQQYLKNNGFGLDAQTMAFVHKAKAKPYYKQNNTLTIATELPRNFESAKIIKGNTYGFREELKKAGYYWNSKDKTWEK